MGGGEGNGGFSSTVPARFPLEDYFTEESGLRSVYLILGVLTGKVFRCPVLCQILLLRRNFSLPGD